MTRVALTGPTAGELSSKVIGRPDLVRYGSGARKLQNNIVHPTGLIEYREGNRFKGKPKYADKRCRVWPFKFSDEQAYVVEWGDFYVRFWKDGGLIVDGGGVPIELATPWDQSQVFQLSFTQSADRLYIFHRNFERYSLNRFSHTSWTLTVRAMLDGPYEAENAPDNSISLAPASGTGTITFTTLLPSFVASDVGRHLRVYDRIDPNLDPNTSSAWIWCVISAFIGPTSVQAVVQGSQRVFSPNAFNPRERFRLGLFSAARGWPACATIHEQRQWIAGSIIAPDRADSSVIGNYDRFSPDTTAADGIGIAAGTPEVDRIKALLPLNDVLAFTGGQELRIGGTSDRAPASPTGVSAKPLSSFGAADVPPILIGNGAVFVDKQGRRLRALVYSNDLQAYDGEDLTLLADHIVGPLRMGGIKGLAYHETPVSLIWIIRSDGDLAACTYSRKENVNAWHHHPLGDVAGGNGADVDSICVIPGPTQDELWSCVRRTVGGVDFRTMERLEWSDPKETPPWERCHLDMSLTLDNKPSAALTLAAPTGSNVLVTASAGVFAPGDVGRWITRGYALAPDDEPDEGDPEDWDPDDPPLWGWCAARIVQYVSGTQVRVDISPSFPFDAAALAQGDWRLSVMTLTGLAAFNGLVLTVVGDGQVLGDFTVNAGQIPLPQPVSIAHVGRRYTGRYWTMPLEAGPSAGILQGRPQRVPRAVMRVLNSVGGRYGTKRKSMQEITPYDAGAPPLQPPASHTRDIPLTQGTEWTGMPAQRIEQHQPLPLNVALVVPDIYAPMVQP